MKSQAAHEESLALAERRRQERRDAKAQAARKRPAQRERRRRMPVTPEQVSARDEWMRIPFLAQCEGCRVEPATERHHAIREQVLRANARTHGYDFEVLRWDTRLRILLCRDCHEHHTSRSRRLPASILRQETVDCAIEIGLLWALEGEYRQEDESQ